MIRPPRTLIIFTRIPLPGSGKTRLSNFLSEDERYLLMRRILSAIIQTCTSYSDRVIIAYDGHPHDLSSLQGLIPTGHRVEFFPQSSGDLGTRMYDAIKKAGAFTVLVGSDIADLSTDHLNQAFDHLEQGVDIVIAPTEDGGFGLVGMRTPKQIFSHMTWSHPRVCHQLCQLLNAQKISYQLIDKLYDIDTKEDLIAYEVKSTPGSWITTEHGTYIHLANNSVAYIPNTDSAVTIPEALGSHAKMIETRLLPRPLAVIPLDSCPARVRTLL